LGTNSNDKYLGWSKLEESDLNYFKLIGKLSSDNPRSDEFPTDISYWSHEYPIAVDYYPNIGADVYTNGKFFYLVYTEFGGHAPEKRCRLIRTELIV
jgi:hypothetical protein